MRRLGSLSLRRKLTSIGMLSSMTALGLMSIALLIYDSYNLKNALVRRLQIEAQIISFNSVSPLLFNDVDAATTTLSGLKAEPTVLAAAVFNDKSDQPVASFVRDQPHADPLSKPPVELRAGGHAFSAHDVLIATPILFEDKVIGSVLVRCSLDEIRDSHRRYAGVVVAVLAGSFLLAALISRLFEKTISRPILRLADVATTVSNSGDYSLRAVAEGRDEIGTLVGTFNDMLDRIQEQNAALEESRSKLEERVEARTRDLEGANKELEAFSYSVSHDLRAPLRAIDGFSKALLDSKQSLDDRGRHYLERVRAGTARMAELIDDMLGLARVSRKELLRQTVDMTSVAASVAAELAKREAGRHVRVEVQQGLSVKADRQLLTILLENLMGNAWKFTGKTVEACIEVGRQGDGHAPALYVKDNGAGFDMTYADKLFGAFQRLHSDADFEGTGIGLATVQRIVSRHGGRVWAEGAVGKGATFFFTLEPN